MKANRLSSSRTSTHVVWFCGSITNSWNAWSCIRQTDLDVYHVGEFRSLRPSFHSSDLFTSALSSIPLCFNMFSPTNLCLSGSLKTFLKLCFTSHFNCLLLLLLLSSNHNLHSGPNLLFTENIRLIILTKWPNRCSFRSDNAYFSEGDS